MDCLTGRLVEQCVCYHTVKQGDLHLTWESVTVVPHGKYDEYIFLVLRKAKRADAVGNFLKVLQQVPSDLLKYVEYFKINLMVIFCLLDVAFSHILLLGELS